jgi:SAM-dependent methyltransferase
VYRAWLTNGLRARAARSRLVKELDGQDTALLRTVDTAISPEDTMWLAGRDRYFRVGLDAIRCIDAACASSGVSTPARILDMPSGAGRVLRFIARRFPDAELTACDIFEDEITFCARRFGAHPVLSSPDFDSLELPGTFELIWSGSLVTHLDAGGTDAFLRLCRRHVSPGGVVVVTTHGEEVAGRVPNDPGFYGLDDKQAEAVVSQYRREGAGFVAYSDPHEPQQAGYSPESAPWGVSLMSREWVRSVAHRAGLRELHFAERDWNAHQDVFAFAAAGS